LKANFRREMVFDEKKENEGKIKAKTLYSGTNAFTIPENNHII